LATMPLCSLRFTDAKIYKGDFFRELEQWSDTLASKWIQNLRSLSVDELAKRYRTNAGTTSDNSTARVSVVSDDGDKKDEKPSIRPFAQVIRRFGITELELNCDLQLNCPRDTAAATAFMHTSELAHQRFFQSFSDAQIRVQRLILSGNDGGKYLSQGALMTQDVLDLTRCSVTAADWRTALFAKNTELQTHCVLGELRLCSKRSDTSQTVMNNIRSLLPRLQIRVTSECDHNRSSLRAF
jgi:hypothetical protein